MDISQQDRELLATNSYKEFLAMEFANRRAKNSRYSQNAMARDLDILASSLSTLFKYKAHFSDETLEKVALNLQKPEPIREYFRNIALAEIYSPGDIYDLHYLKAREIRLKYMYAPISVPHRMVDKWELSTLALALLLRIEGEARNDEVLCKRLNITADSLSQMLSELESLGWIERTDAGHVSNIRHIELGNQGTAYHIQNLNKKVLKHTLWAIENLPYESRSSYSSFFTMDSERYSVLNEKLRKFALTIGDDEGPAKPGHDVYAIGTFLIPLTHSE